MPSKKGHRRVRIRATKKRPRLPDGRLAPRFQRLSCPCGRVFSSNQPGARYCSVRCKNYYNYRRLNSDATIPGYSKIKECPTCGALFVTTRDARRYCYNKTCARSAKAKRDKERRREV